MSFQKYKDVEIGSRRFRVGTVTARKAAWIYAQIQLGKIGDESVFQRIQDHLLSVCSLYKVNPDGTEVPMPIYEAPYPDQPGRWLLPEAQEFEYDLALVQKLMETAMEVSIGPFLKERASAQQKAQATNP